MIDAVKQNAGRISEKIMLALSPAQKRSSRYRFLVKKSTIFIILITFLMILPDDVFSWLSLYESMTPSEIRYVWLTYRFGILQAAILVIGIYYTARLRLKWVTGILVLMGVREIFCLFASEHNIVQASAYEMYLVLAVGFSFLVWTFAKLNSVQEFERLLKWCLVANMLTLYVDFIMGGSGGLIEGRYHASNLDVGGTGMVCALCIIFIGFSREKNKYNLFLIGLSAAGLILSGSRANFLFLLMTLGVTLLTDSVESFLRGENRAGRNTVIRRIAVFFIAVLILVAFVFLTHGAVILSSEIERFQSLFQAAGVARDRSFTGRTASLIVGMRILKEHPLGISGYFVNLQRECWNRGFPTFPHSTLLSMYLLFGPITFIPYCMWFHLWRKLREIHSRYAVMILYLIIDTIPYGGPITNFKFVFFYGIVTILAVLTVQNTD